MKRLFSLLLVFALLLGTAWATGGDPNLEGGGGETGTGTGTNRWYSGNDGIRGYSFSCTLFLFPESFAQKGENPPNESTTFDFPQLFIDCCKT